MPSRISVSSKRLLWLILNEQQSFVPITTRGTCRCSYHSTSSLRASSVKGDDDKDDKNTSTDSFKSKNGPIKLASILHHASQQSKALLNGINGNSSTKNHPAHHFVAGGTPCDPAPPPFRLAEYGEDSLYTLVLLRHGESEWNALNRKCLRVCLCCICLGDTSAGSLKQQQSLVMIQNTLDGAMSI